MEGEGKIMSQNMENFARRFDKAMETHKSSLRTEVQTNDRNALNEYQRIADQSSSYMSEQMNLTVMPLITQIAT